MGTKIGLKEPFRAPLFQSSISQSPSTVSLPAHMKDKPVTIEAEFGFKLNREFKPTEKKYTAKEVIAGIGEIMCAIEVCGTRFGNPSVGLFHKFADGGGNIAVIFGQPYVDIPKIAHELKDSEATLTVDGVVCGRGTGKNVLENPLLSLLWLINNLSRSGVTLERGPSIISGCLCKCQARKGQTITASFSGMKDISATLN